MPRFCYVSCRKHILNGTASTRAFTDVGIGAMDRVRMMHLDIAGVSLNQPVNVPVQFTDENKV